MTSVHPLPCSHRPVGRPPASDLRPPTSVLPAWNVGSGTFEAARFPRPLFPPESALRIRHSAIPQTDQQSLFPPNNRSPLTDNAVRKSESPPNDRKPTIDNAPRSRAAFTLIELLVVITIIIILMGLLFPAFKGVQDQAKRTQAKNDLTQIVTAVNAYYTDYGKYPIPAASQGVDEDYTYSYDGSASAPNSALVKILQNDPSATADNPRGVVFFSGPVAKSTGSYGIQPSTSADAFTFKDAWGKGYSVCIDSNYNDKVRERGTGNLLTTGAIAWSLGKDGDWDKSGIASWK